MEKKIKIFMGIEFFSLLLVMIFFTLLFLKLKLMIFFNWLRARLAFILASFEFGAERFIFAPPSFTKKRDYVSAREKVRMTSFRAKKRHVNRRGTRGK